MLCNVCKIQGSNYKCPKCSINYCSLKCYQSHQCYELFLKENITNELKGKKADEKDTEKMIGILKRMQDLDMNEEEAVDPKEIEKMELRELLGLLNEQQLKEFHEFIKTDSVHHLIKVKEPWWHREIQIREKEIEPFKRLKFNFETNPALIYSSIELVYSYVKAYRTMNCEYDEDFLEMFQTSYVLRSLCILESVAEAMDLVEEPYFNDIKAIYQSKDNVLRVFGEMIEYMESAFGLANVTREGFANMKETGPPVHKRKRKTMFLLLKKLQYFYALIDSMDISPLYESISNFKKVEHKELIKEL
ncbi:hypothetical protein HDV06_002613 [Boothiomyces sp. JEL0866]|nr:hypothetical protein HDV06_002613 [Boothiomyces sp. JEL0866]